MKLNIHLIELGDIIRVKIDFREKSDIRTQFYVGVLYAKNETDRNSIRIIRNEFNGEIEIERILYFNAPSIEYDLV